VLLITILIEGYKHLWLTLKKIKLCGLLLS